jgi:hypothetical protein
MKLLPIYFFLIFTSNIISAQTKTKPDNVLKLIKAYPNHIIDFKDNKLVFRDGSTLIYDDGISNKSKTELLNNPDIEDQFFYSYLKLDSSVLSKNAEDPGRIRNENFFKKMYGNTKEEVEKKLVEITWCPKSIGQKIKVTKVNGVDKAFLKISEELDKMPEFKQYLTNIGGTFKWRNINGTNRLSMHSFGMTMDINITFSDYWQWSCTCTNEDAKLNFKNRIPLKIVEIFEKNGFIWGGKWVHFDTMHFEFRPELLNK